MKNQNFPFVVRAYILTHKGLQKAINLLTACFTGFWLGILKRETLHFVDEVYYDNTKMYLDEEHNRGGLFKWEQKAINKYFQKCKCLLVAGAGGGREVLALRKLGYDVDGFECNPRLLEYANKLLSKEGLIPDIQLCPRDHCPDSTKIYDGFVVGWSAYMLLQRRKQRVAFLKKLRALAQEQSPILLSFFSRSDKYRRFKVITTIANAIRWIPGRKPVELGDNLSPCFVNSGEGAKLHLPYYVHHFTKEEIASELREGGFELNFYCTDEYTHAVGIASKNNKPNI